MYTRLKSLLVEPRLWMGLGVLLFCAGWGLSYLEDHRLAEAVRQEQARLPAPVFVQAYDNDSHRNAFGEVSVIGEVDFALAETVVLDDGARYVLIPAFDVSPGGRRAGERRIFDVLGSGGATPPHRPVARPVRPKPMKARAVLIFELKDGEDVQDGFGLNEIGSGFGGTIVHATGHQMDVAVLGGEGTAAIGHLAGYTGTGDLLLLSPFPKRALHDASQSRLTHSADWKMWLGAILVLAGILARLQTSQGALGATQVANRPIAKTKASSSGYLDIFAPIASQDELRSEASEPLTLQGRLIDVTAVWLGRIAGYLADIKSRR